MSSRTMQVNSLCAGHDACASDKMSRSVHQPCTRWSGEVADAGRWSPGGHPRDDVELQATKSRPRRPPWATIGVAECPVGSLLAEKVMEA
ncbi:hypothetical protein ACPXCG_18275 [Gordonia sp. DT218]|uniref:hypothetical protein n=1 Tax=Gordonia sp. DT218 TaxID=3416659 RepID=UPI003CF1AA11